MVSIARALLLKPKVLLLDEPFEGLAPRVIASLTRALKGLQEEGMAMLFAVSGLVTRAHGIDRGTMVHEGSPSDFIEDPEVRRRIWGF